MTVRTGVQRRRATNALALAIGTATLAVCLISTNGAAQCLPSWDGDFITGTGATFFGSMGDGIKAFAEFDDGSGKALYVVGNFTAIDGVSATSGFARWDGASGGWTGLGLGFTGSGSSTLSPRSIAVFDDGSGSGPAIYVGGPFTTIGGVDANQVARYDHLNDTWTPLASGVNFTSNGVGNLIALDNHLYAIGSTSSGFFNYAGIARWDGSAWTHIAVPATSSGIVLGVANDAAVLDGNLYIAGSSGSAPGRVVRLDGTSLTPIGAIGSNALSLAAFQGTLYAGRFCAAGGTDIGNCVYRWDGGTTWTPAFGSASFIINRPSPGPAVRALHAANDPETGLPTLYVGGNILKPSPDPAVSIVKFDGTNWGRLPIGVFTSTGGGNVDSIFGYNDGSGHGIYAGGSFDRFQTVPGGPVTLSRGIARWGCFDQAPAVDPDTSHLLASSAIISGYGGHATITIIPRDGDGALLPAGRDVVINASAGNLIGSVDDLGDGTYTQVLEGVSTEAGALVTASVDGVNLNASASITFVPIDTVASTIELDVDQVFEGGSAIVTVTPADDAGDPVGPGFSVVIATTLGDLAGAVSDNGDGTYTQTLLATTVGTASVTATVNGLPLDTSASLSVLDPAIYGNIVGINASGDIVAFLSIQEAVDSGLVSTIFVVAGTYDETIQINGRSGLTIIGLPGAASDPVVVRGFVISDSADISIQHLRIEAGSGPNDGIRLRGGPRASAGIQITGCTITGATMSGIYIDRDNSSVLIEGCLITGNGRNGIDAHLSGFNYIVRNSTITANGYNGVSIGRDVEIMLEGNAITGNGVASGSGGGRWGIDRQRKPLGGTPTQVTLIQNVIENNNGKPKAGTADQNINNYDQIIDETDDQPPYTD